MRETGGAFVGGRGAASLKRAVKRPLRSQSKGWRPEGRRYNINTLPLLRGWNRAGQEQR